MKTIEERREYFRNFQTNDSGFLPSAQEGWHSRKCMVILTAHNEEEFIKETLKSIELTMRNLDWVMVFGDDGSSDRTLEIVNDFKIKSSATEFDIYSFEKASNVASAKNRTIQRSLLHANQYKWIFLMDGDDIMGAGRAKGLLKAALEEPNYFYLGDWTYCYEGEETARKAEDSYHKCNFGPWATMINSEVIPENGELFYEGKDVHEDLILWKELFIAGVSMTAVEGINTCYYNSRVGTLSKHKDVRQRKEIWRDHRDFCRKNILYSAKEKIELERAEEDIMKNPLAALKFAEGSPLSAVPATDDNSKHLMSVSTEIERATKEESQKAREELDLGNVIVDVRDEKV
jgi:hypothetical protein